MNQSKGPARPAAPTLPTATGATGPAPANAAGPAGVDARGHAAAESRTDARPFEDNSRNARGQKFAAPNLSIESTAVSRQGSDAPPEAPDDCFNPYNRSGQEAVKSAQIDRSPPRQASRIVVTSRKQPGLMHGLMQRLSGRNKSGQ